MVNRIDDETVADIAGWTGLAFRDPRGTLKRLQLAKNGEKRSRRWVGIGFRPMFVQNRVTSQPLTTFFHRIPKILAAGIAVFAAVAGARAGPTDDGAALFKPNEILQRVNGAIRWHEEVQAGGLWLSQPSDVFYWDTERDLAGKALAATLGAARSQLPLVAASTQAVSSAASTAQQQRLAQLAGARSDHIDAVQAEIAAVELQRRDARDPAVRDSLAARAAALESERNFLEKLRDALTQMGGLLSEANGETGAPTLAGQLDSLQQSVSSELASTAPPAAADPAAGKGMESGGLIARSGALLRLLNYRRGIDRLLADNEQLSTQIAQAQAQVRDALRAVQAAGDQVGQRVEAAVPVHPAESQRQLEALAARFGHLWDLLIPLRQEARWYDQSARNLQQWRDSINRRISEIARTLIIRAGAAVIMLIVVVGLSEIWRRMAFRYVGEERRRRQILLIRRFVTVGLMIGAVATQFISDFGSLAAFAGLMTAGIAVALQTIIVSVAAYFFLLGRYGLKVGDRISAGGVTGEVSEIGLVRFHMRELAASGPDLHPTGRIVTFPNSVIFQANPVFKQLPGTEYTWHEAAVTLATGSNASLVRDRMLAAVTTAYGEYLPLIDRPRGAPEKPSGLKTELPRPYAALRARDLELDLVVGYPVSFRHVSEIDQLVLKHVADAIASDSALARAISGHPRIGAAVRN